MGRTHSIEHEELEVCDCSHAERFALMLGQPGLLLQVLRQPCRPGTLMPTLIRNDSG